MTFGEEVLAIFIADVLASFFVLLCYILVQWFLRATDLRIGYAWKWRGSEFYPALDIRNRSRSSTYRLGNIAYTRCGEAVPIWIDNRSLWDKELKPGSINFYEVAPVRGINSADEALKLEVGLRLQNGRSYWLKGKGPGQLKAGKILAAAFWLRDKIERSDFPIDIME